MADAAYLTVVAAGHTFPDFAKTCRRVWSYELYEYV